MVPGPTMVMEVMTHAVAPVTPVSVFVSVRRTVATPVNVSVGVAFPMPVARFVAGSPGRGNGGGCHSAAPTLTRAVPPGAA